MSIDKSTADYARRLLAEMGAELDKVIDGEIDCLLGATDAASSPPKISGLAVPRGHHDLPGAGDGAVTGRAGEATAALAPPGLVRTEVGTPEDLGSRLAALARRLEGRLVRARAPANGPDAPDPRGGGEWGRHPSLPREARE